MKCDVAKRAELIAFGGTCARDVMQEVMRLGAAQGPLRGKSDAEPRLILVNALLRYIAHAEIVEISPRGLGATNYAPLMSRHSDQEQRLR